MAHPSKDLESLVRAAVVAAYGEEHATVDPAVHRSSFADFQADVALRLARAVKRPPLDVARTIADRLNVSEVADDVKVSPPGFINFRLRREYLERAVLGVASDARAGVPPVSTPETIVVDYSAPNVAKEMHVGHLRPTIIGDSIVRLLDFTGHRVIRQNHIGDWGTPFGMLIEHMIDLGLDAGAEHLEIGAFNEFYRDARKKFDAEPDFAERARLRVVALQSGETRSLALWQALVALSRRYFRQVYAKFDVLLTDDDVRGESFYNPLLDGVVKELEEKGIARVDNGALCVFLPEFKGRDGEPLPLIVRKSDGGYGYATTDLAAIRYRVKELSATRILYVVGAPQQQHFAMVFATARLAGWIGEGVRAEHVAFGSILGADRKTLRTRSGETPRLLDLLDEAEQRAESAILEKNPELSPEARTVVASQVGIGAIKYADLSSERMKDYVFDLDRMVSFEGNTGPYLQYAHARISSILRRGADEGVTLAETLSKGSVPEDSVVLLNEPAERALALQLLDFGAAVEAVSVALQPHRLATYLYELATHFSAFFESCPVLRAETPELRASRLVLSAATRRTLAIGLSLLGMAAPERM